MLLTRRSFGQLIAYVAGGALARVPPATARTVPLLDVAMAGGGYHGLDRRRATLAAGRRLRLAREPENPFDPNAVAILDVDGLRLGYVPRRVAGTVAALIDAGEDIRAEVVGALTGSPQSREDFVATDFRVGDPRVRLSRPA